MNISRPDFAKSIDINGEQSTASDLAEIFDEIMALYNIVSEDYVKVHREPDAGYIAKFTVKFVSEQKAQEIFNTVSHQETTVYGKVIQLICWKTESPDTLIMSFHSVSS